MRINHVLDFSGAHSVTETDTYVTYMAAQHTISCVNVCLRANVRPC